MTAKEGAADKLVLTASLRVDDESEEAVPTEKTVEDQGVAEVSSSEEVADNDVFESAAEENSGEDEEDAEEEFLDYVTSKDLSVEESTAPDETLSVEEVDAEQALERLNEILSDNNEKSLEFMTDGELADVDEGDSQEEATALSANLTDKAAAFETIVAQKEDLWDPDGTTQDDNAAQSGWPVPWQDQDETDAADDIDYAADPLSVFDRSPNVPETAEDKGASDDPVTDAGTGTAEKVTALKGAEATEEAEADDTLAEIAPDDRALTAEAATFTFKAHDRAASQRGGRANAADSAGMDAQIPFEETLLDEDALRDIVSEIVRQELQGALGERITRNVRKLVRREIHRALASQQLE